MGGPHGACPTVRRELAAGRRPDGLPARGLPDLVGRNFTASKPNELWVVDFTYVATWAGTVFSAFVTDVFSRRIVGWRTKATMPTELPLDALEMALWTPPAGRRTRRRARAPLRGQQPVHRYPLQQPPRRCRSLGFDRGRQLRQRHGRVGHRALQGRVRPPRRPLARGRRPRARHPHWVWWFNEIRLHGQIGHIPPTEYETAYYRHNQTAGPPGPGRTSPPLNPGRFIRRELHTVPNDARISQPSLSFAVR